MFTQFVKAIPPVLTVGKAPPLLGSIVVELPVVSP